jgi:hypothetical protein
VACLQSGEVNRISVTVPLDEAADALELLAATVTCDVRHILA